MGALPIGQQHFEAGHDCNPPEPADAWDGGWPQTPQAFETLVDAYLDRLVRYAFRRLGSIDDAEDVVQEVFVRAFADRARHKRIARPGPYLYRMVANACTDCLRKRRRAASLEDLGDHEIRSPARNPAQLAAAAEDARRTEELLRRLPRKQAEVIRLRVFEELRLGEIAEVVGCSIHTVSSRLRYGFRKLRKIVLKEGIR